MINKKKSNPTIREMLDAMEQTPLPMYRQQLSNRIAAMYRIDRRELNSEVAIMQSAITAIKESKAVPEKSVAFHLFQYVLQTDKQVNAIYKKTSSLVTTMAIAMPNYFRLKTLDDIEVYSFIRTFERIDVLAVLERKKVIDILAKCFNCNWWELGKLVRAKPINNTGEGTHIAFEFSDSSYNCELTALFARYTFDCPKNKGLRQESKKVRWIVDLERFYFKSPIKSKDFDTNKLVDLVKKELRLSGVCD